MIYLLDKFDLDLIKPERDKYQYVEFHFWEVPEKKIEDWLRYERSRSIFSKKEIVGLFKLDFPIQMVQIEEIRVGRYDKIIVWTPNKRYFVFEVTNLLN